MDGLCVWSWTSTEKFHTRQSHGNPMRCMKSWYVFFVFSWRQACIFGLLGSTLESPDDTGMLPLGPPAAVPVMKKVNWLNREGGNSHLDHVAVVGLTSCSSSCWLQWTIVVMCLCSLCNVLYSAAPVVSSIWQLGLRCIHCFWIQRSWRDQESSENWNG